LSKARRTSSLSLVFTNPPPGAPVAAFGGSRRDLERHSNLFDREVEVEAHEQHLALTHRQPCQSSLGIDPFDAWLRALIRLKDFRQPDGFEPVRPANVATPVRHDG
jgi:hypothetical protein